jgi:hypothetical protein
MLARARSFRSLAPRVHATCVAQCGEPHVAALVYLLADYHAHRGDFVALFEHAQRPWNLGHPSPCCLTRRVLLYLEEAPHLVAESVAAGALEFAAQALEEYPACARPVATRYLALAAGGDRVRRALQTGALPHLLTYIKDIAKRCDTPSSGFSSQEDWEWDAASQALLNLAGSVDGPPHPAGGTRGTPQPQVVEEFVRAGLPRLYLTRAVALARHAHALAEEEDAEDLLDWLPQQLRLLGHVFRACVLLASTPKKADGRLLMTLVAALRANADVEQLQTWALRYCFLPLAYGEITRGKGGPAFARAGFFACRLACCAPRRGMGNAPETLTALQAAGALPVILAAAEKHSRCRRSASRLLAYLAQGDLAARRLLEEHGAAATMLRVQADVQMRLGREKLDLMASQCSPELKQMLVAGHIILESALKPCLVDSDALAPAGADGCSLSECDLEEELEYDPGNLQTTMAAQAVAGTSGMAGHYGRLTLLTRALCALTGAPNVAQAATARSASAADECAAALLAEEEAEKAALAKKKPKKKKPKKKVSSAELDEASDGDDEEEETVAEALGDKALAAGAMRATLVPPPQPFRSPAAALAAQPPPAKQKKTKQKAAAPPEAVKPQPPPVYAKRPPSPPPPAPQAPMLQPVQLLPIPAFVNRPPSPSPPPKPQAPLLPPLPPVQAPPVLPPLPMAAPRVVAAVPLPAPPLARTPSAVEELFPWLAVHDSPPSTPAGPLADAAHEDDELCLVCLDEPRSVALPGCGGAHPPVLCAGCVAWLRRSNAPTCPLCRAPLDAPT